MTHKQLAIPLAFAILTLFIVSCQSDGGGSFSSSKKELSNEINGVKYTVGNWAHPDYGKPFTSLGNHRFEITTNAGEELVQAIIPWRRHDKNPEKKRVIITEAESGKEIQALKVVKANQEEGHIVFRANPEVNRYFVYYFPHQSTGGYYPKLTYLTNTGKTIDKDLAQMDNRQIEKLPRATVISAQSIDAFHSFYPMELIATKTEMDQFFQKNKKDCYLFPEYRQHPIVMDDYLPFLWMNRPYKNQLKDEVRRGEYYTFQIGLYSPTRDLDNLEILISDLKGKDDQIIPQDKLTCFNTAGIDLNGVPFKKELNVERKKVQALWFGVAIPEEASTGVYKSWIKIGASRVAMDSVELVLNIKPEVIPNHGDDQPENMTRLRWLNSTVGADTNFIVPPFTEVVLGNDGIDLLGRKVMLGPEGLPKQIQSYFSKEMTFLQSQPEDILDGPMAFEITTSNGRKEQWQSSAINYLQKSGAKVNWEVKNESQNFIQHIEGRLEYEGMLSYTIQLVAKKDVNLQNTIFRIPYKKDAATYMLGLGEKGRTRPSRIDWKWDVNFHHEGLWLGNINKGLQYVLRDENYERPLNTNFYHNKPLLLPTSWGNEGKGGIRAREFRNQVVVENYAGARAMKTGDTLYYNIRFLITPFKTIDPKAHFNTRFVHKYVPVDTVLDYGGTVVNVHHAHEINPYINYPFFNVEQQKAYIDEAHSKGVKVKLYNTIRELTYKAHELHAMRSLGHEIFNDGEGGGHSWLQEHLVSDYHSAWHAWRVNDAAILNKGTSRWTNYYIAGLNWLAQNQEIDGLYLDDIAFSRETVKRIVNVLSKHRNEVIIDLHSANQFNERDGYINSTFLYMEHIPYVTRLWFGEYFDYNAKPDYWMTEVSGIPFGVPGEMLEKGGHPYRGLVYGMTTRVYHDFDPSGLWKLFDEFNIADSRMLGYWVDDSPIKIKDKNFKNTVYINGEKILIAIGSWSGRNEKVRLDIDWNALGGDRKDYKIYSPKVEGLQKFEAYKTNKRIPIEKNWGKILILEPSEGRG